MAKLRRRFELNLELGADSEEALLSALNQIHYELSVKEQNNQLSEVKIISGGYASSWILLVNEDVGITNESYRREIEEWLKKEEK